MIARRLVITGRVQGVGYRAWFGERALGLGVAGWVRNQSDGSVEAVIAGPPESVNEMVKLAHQGPPAVVVERITVSDEAPIGIPTGFEQRPSA